MFHTLFVELSESIIALTIGMARLYPCLFLVPAFAFREIKGMLRHSIILALALVPMPGIRLSIAGNDLSWLDLGGLVLKESLIGLLLGLLLAMPFWMFESVGCLFDNQRGALIGGQINPALGDNTSELGHMFKQILILLLILGGGYASLTQVVWDSYAIWPANQWLPMPTADGLELYLTLLASTFRFMVLYAAPLVGLLLLIEFGMAILSLYSPQLQVSTLAMPAKSLVGLGFLVLYLPMLCWLGNGQLAQLTDLKHLLPLLLQPGNDS
ncbi:type III secretion system export apparatus subunit SctT [Pseudomonas chlororaphis]|uniref:type III secretion system export apparatus subunit SctT n=1 Tax=Pseudomonas chlororaphis TaxID=587753 RepID=UPI000F586FB2|nr:type III secretion system export apparatus subunit SctT [Pseudomonas chlororaphis]AZC84010.1 Type III secretion inner membrane protein (YscT,HrcT,SpaR,EscT,EpaR1) [Pseudomonas chlororaphis subsp. piscium]